MKTATVSQFQANPSHYLQYVQRGLSVLLLDRRKPIAILRPVEPQDDEDAFRKRLQMLGIVRAAIAVNLRGQKKGSIGPPQTMQPPYKMDRDLP